jgi:branched-chain amino acid transport system permease protein
VHQLWGAVVGSTLLSYASAELGREVTYWRGVLGLFIMLIMVASPSGLLGLLERLPWLRRAPGPGAAGGATKAAG